MKKTGFLFGLSVGVFLTLRADKSKVDSARKLLDEVFASDVVQSLKLNATRTVDDAFRSTGRALTDRVATGIKERYFPEQPHVIEGGYRMKNPIKEQKEIDIIDVNNSTGADSLSV